MKQHFYDEEGGLQFDLNRELLVELYDALPRIDMKDKTARSAERMQVMDDADSIAYEWDINKSFSTEEEEEWFKTDEDTPAKTVLKKMLADMIEREFVGKEFILVARSAICDIQITQQI